MTSNDPFRHSGRVVEVQLLTSAPPENAWAAWADPRRLSAWFADHASGDAVQGKTVVWTFERFRLEIESKVLAAVPNNRLVLGASDESPPFLLELDIEPADGMTKITLRNSGFGDDEENFLNVESGWKMALGILGLYLEKYFEEERTNFLAVRDAEFQYDRVFAHFTDPTLLARWLTNEGTLSAQDGGARLILRDGRILSGRLLASTGREVALEWQEIKGFLEMKAFTYGDGKRALCLRGSGWGLDPDEGGSIEAFFVEALERLVAALASG